MKVEQGQPEGFRPITITIETQLEADIMYANLNCPADKALAYAYMNKISVTTHGASMAHYNMFKTFAAIYR